MAFVSVDLVVLFISSESFQKHRFQIFKKLGVNSMNYFFELQRNLSCLTVNLLLDFSEIFNIFRIIVFFFFFKKSRKFSKKLNTIVNSQDKHTLWIPTIWRQAKLFQSSGL